MINPERITKYDRTTAELQEFLLFCVLVHGKSAKIQAVKLEHFLSYLAHITGESLPFVMVDIARNMEDEETGETLLSQAMRKFGLGQYGRLTQCIDDLLLLPELGQVSVEQLEQCFAIGPKTARFFVVHSRPDQSHAILDCHILKWLRGKGIDTPKNTPQGKWYAHFEKIFLTFVVASGKSVAEFDLDIWKSFAT